MAFTSYLLGSKDKDPDAVLDYLIDWSSWLDADTIAASTFSAPAGITVNSSTFSTTTTTVWLAGGSLGASYVITNHVTTAGGREDDRSFIIRMKDK